MNVIKIIKEVFDKAGFGDYTVKVSESDYPDIEYCVQYRESDLTFVSRLMEEFGLYVFYEHSRDKHNLVLADSRSCHRKIPISAACPSSRWSGTIDATASTSPNGRRSGAFAPARSRSTTMIT